MIKVDTRTAKTHRILRYLDLTFKTVVIGASFVLAYYIVVYGI
jgi:hypothetical protein